MQIDPTTPLAFVDLETTGTSPRHHRVIEIGIARVEDEEVVQRYRTFVDPGTLVPPFITSLTGISSAMLVDVPQFKEVAFEVAEMLAGALFIAHNAPFDYGFLSEEFKRIGVAFSYPYLCTAKLSRALFPKQHRHNLDTIIEKFALDAGARHRALDDALVLYQFLQVVREQLGESVLHEAMQEIVRVRRLPYHMKEDMLTALPERPGVYSFYGKDNELLYVGKSRKIRTRVRSHFAHDGLSGRGKDMLSEIRRIDHKETAGEFGALLLELHLIRTLKPTYNVRKQDRHALCLARECTNEHGYTHIVLDRADTIDLGKEKNIAAVFTTKHQAHEVLGELAEEYGLCLHLLGIEEDIPCSAQQLEKCKGACVGKEKPRHYNKRVREAFVDHRLKPWPFTGPVGIEESAIDGTGQLFVIDNWRLLAALQFEDGAWQEFVPAHFHFDYDTYKIFSRELLKKRPKVIIRQLTTNEEALLQGE